MAEFQSEPSPSPSLSPKPTSEWVKLSVGGRSFSTLQSTLEKSQFFKNHFNNVNIIQIDENGSLLLDRDPDLFALLLHGLRSGKVFLPTLSSPLFDRESIKNEAKFFGIDNSLLCDPVLTWETLSLRIKFTPMAKSLGEIRTVPTWSFSRSGTNLTSATASEYDPIFLNSPVPVEDYPLEVVLAAP